MEERLDACLILGCNGYALNKKFAACLGIENIILELTVLDQENYEIIVKFFEKACGLFDAPVNDYNKCVSIITMLHRDYGIINQDTLKHIQFFLKMHKSCGIYLLLIMREDFGVK